MQKNQPSTTPQSDEGAVYPPSHPRLTHQQKQTRACAVERLPLHLWLRAAGASGTKKITPP
jgi:hypothetical protein